MDISLEMIRDQWMLDGTVLHIVNGKHRFYRELRMAACSENSAETNRIETVEAVLFIQQSCSWECDNSIPENCAVVTLKEPDAEVSAEREYLWVEGTSDLYAVMNELLSVFSYYNRIERELERFTYMQHGLQEMIGLLSRVCGNPAYVTDEHFHALAMEQANPDLSVYSINWKRIREHGYLPFHVVDSILQNEQWIDLRRSEKPILTETKEFSVPFVISNLRKEGRVRWHLFICELEKYITPADLDLIEAAGTYIEKCLLTGYSYKAAEGHYYDYFLRDVMSGNLLGSQLIQEQLKPLGWTFEGLFCVMELENREEDSLFFELLSTQMEKLAGGKSFLYREKEDVPYRFMTVFQLPSRQEYSQLLKKLESVLSMMKCRGGISDLYRRFNKLSSYEKQAGRALASLVNADSSCCLKTFQSIVWEELMQVQEKENLERLVDPLIIEMIEYDQLHHSEYAETMQVFLEQERNLIRTSKQLHIHRNTLVYRLEKMKELFAIELDDCECRARYILSFQIYNYQRRMNG